MGIIIRATDYPLDIPVSKYNNSLGSKISNTSQIEQLDSDLRFLEPNSKISSNLGSTVRKRKKIPKPGRILLFVKGADFVMKQLTKHVDSPLLTDRCEELAFAGLRTLGFSFKRLSKETLKGFKKEYRRANRSPDSEVARVKAETELMQNLDFLGVSGVEDKLQEDCAETIQMLQQAGIRVWVLTGDKIETVQCIAISTGLKTESQTFYVIKGSKSPESLRASLDAFSISGDKSKQILIVDGRSLAQVFPDNEEFFFKLACDSAGVIFCRCSPTQKAEVAAHVRLKRGLKTLCVGDGGNDVPMILAADVGVGIQGLEGKQAAMASDFSLVKFRDLAPLILYHGRNSYKRGAVMSLFVLHRGLIISFMQVLFSLLFGKIKLPVFNGVLMLGYSTIFTMLPVFSLVFSEDVSLPGTLKFPRLYQKLQKGRELSLRKFLQWTFKSLFQALLILVAFYIILPYNYTEASTAAFTALIFTELLNTIGNVHSFAWQVVVSLLLSLLAFFGGVLYFPHILQTAPFEKRFATDGIIVALIGVIPLEFFSFLRKLMMPTEVNKLNKKVKPRGKGIIKKITQLLCCCCRK